MSTRRNEFGIPDSREMEAEVSRLRAALEQLPGRFQQAWDKGMRYTRDAHAHYGKDVKGWLCDYSRAALSTPPAPSDEAAIRGEDSCHICDGQGCIQDIGKTCPECGGSGKAIERGEDER